MAKFTSTIRSLMGRFGVNTPARNGLDALRQVLTSEELEILATAFQLDAERLQAMDMVDSLVATRRHDDRTNFIEEIAFKGGWRRDKGDPPSSMYLNYMVIITEPQAGSLDNQRLPVKGRPIRAGDGTEVFIPINGDGRIDLGSDPAIRENVDFYVHMFQADADKAGLKPVRNDRLNRWEWPVVKCQLKKHFMFACQALVFDKEMNLAWQGAFRRGQLTRQDAEKMYARLNWVGPQSKKDLAALYALLLHSGINHYADWIQWQGLTLGGETFYGGEDYLRYHTYGTHRLVNESLQWAVLNWIVDHGVDGWNLVGVNGIPGQSRSWTSTEFLEFLKDDLVFYAYDHADNAALEKVYLDVVEGDVSVVDGDNLIKMTGKTTGIYSHRPPEVRERVVRDLHLAVSEAARAKIQKSFDRETMTRGDLNKFYDPDRGAFHRFKDIQDARRDADLDLLDEIEFKWFTHPSLGMAAIGAATRAKANDLIEKGFGKHRKKRSPWNNRVSWETLLRFADYQDQRYMYDLMQAAAGGRILDMGAVRGILRSFGTGYDPHEDCSEYENGCHFRGDGHAHRNVHACEGRKWYKQEGRWVEEPYEHWMRRVVAMRKAEGVLSGWFNMVYDNRKFLARYLSMRPPNAVAGEDERTIRAQQLLAGKGSEEFYFKHSELVPHSGAIKAETSAIEHEFGLIADILYAGVDADDIAVVREGSIDFWFDMMMFVLGAELDGGAGDRNELRASLRDEYNEYYKSPYGGYLERVPQKPKWL